MRQVSLLTSSITSSNIEEKRAGEGRGGTGEGTGREAGVPQPRVLHTGWGMSSALLEGEGRAGPRGQQ